MFNAGDAVGLEVFAHRQLWNGTVCSGAESWQCGASPDFREDYCARGDPRCFVKDVFDTAHPQLVFRAAEQGLTAPQTQLKNQIMLLWSRRTREPFGIGEPKSWSLAGLYRIREATSVSIGIWSARPHADGWVNLTSLNMELPRYDHIPSARRMRRFEPATVRKLLQQATAAATRPATALPDEQKKRLEKASSLLDAWFDAAKIDGEPLQKLFGGVPAGAPSSGGPAVVAGDDRKLVNPMRGLDALKRVEPGAWDGAKAGEPSGPVRRPSEESGPVRRPADTVGTTDAAPKVTKDGADGKAKVNAPTPATPVPVAALAAAAPTTSADPIGLRSVAAKIVAETYGSDVLRKVQVALLTKPLLILRGNPGVGKSNLAKMLSDARLIVAIGSTWRGREDLLGYVNPINQLFEPTAFCHFIF